MQSPTRGKRSNERPLIQRHGALSEYYAGQRCSRARNLEIVGERWTLLILRDAFFGVRRFGDFLAHLGTSRAVLPSASKPCSRPACRRRRPAATATASTSDRQMCGPAAGLTRLARLGRRTLPGERPAPGCSGMCWTPVFSRRPPRAGRVGHGVRPH
ncbi:winged helix-turn-helix transcriptional regulator [Amycolatopsis sp. NPDC023774]|uniref:winged helix-turn-helix transcriptional regulator n=1 Tax=Amycolatopsis sp. NPDC023774 TaxID=3155015 RepID=UPI0033FE1132